MSETHKQSYLAALDRYTHMRIGATTPAAFYDAYVRPVESQIRIRSKRGYLDSLMQHFAEHMPQHDTYSSFLSMLTGEEMGFDCAFFQKWLPEFIRTIIPIPLGDIDWIIDSQTVKDWNTKFIVASNNSPDASSGTYWGGHATNHICKVNSFHRVVKS